MLTERTKIKRTNLIIVALVLIILIGLFVDKKDNQFINYGLLGVGVIIFIVVLIKTSGYLGWYSGYWWSAHWPEVIGVIALIAIVGAIIGSVSGKNPKAPQATLHWPPG